MTFENFQRLFTKTKRVKLKYAFDKINNKFSEYKWIGKCCPNINWVEVIYQNTIEMVINTQGFLRFIFEGIGERPTCFKHKPSILGLDYLVRDF